MRVLILAGVAALAIAGAAQAQVGERVGRAATRPLRDTRIIEDKIPPVLQRAASAPYAQSGAGTCKQIASSIAELDAVLKADFDGVVESTGEGARLAGVATGEAIRTIVPGLGLVRYVTGADKQQQRVEAAVLAGAVRRGYLKGIGLSKGCKPPAAPKLAARRATPHLLPAKK
jgi:hypothetical protein